MKVYTKLIVHESEFRNMLANWYATNGEESISEIISRGHLDHCALWSWGLRAKFDESLSPVVEFWANIDKDIVSEAVKSFCVSEKKIIDKGDRIYVTRVNLNSNTVSESVEIEFYKE